MPPSARLSAQDCPPLVQQPISCVAINLVTQIANPGGVFTLHKDGSYTFDCNKAGPTPQCQICTHLVVTD